MVRAEDENAGPSGYGKTLRTVGPLLTAGIQMAVAVGLVGFLGYLLDASYGTTPWLLLAGLLLGGGAGFYLFLRTVNEVNRKEQEETRKS